MSTPASAAADYCRQIESYLCRRNSGHLIRIVGPAFEKVAGWAGQGIPIKVAFRGIDRRVEREESKGPRRRPVRIEFCEADVLDAFDEWRRAVGAVVGSRPADEPGRDAGSGDDTGSEAAPAKPRRVALQAHIDRVMARLTQRRLESGVDRALGDAIDAALRDLDGLRAHAHGARGDARQGIVQALRELDDRLMQAARATMTANDLARHDADARRDLQPFKDRMPAPAFEQAVIAAARRVLR